MRMFPLVAPSAAAEPDFGASFEDGDEHDVADSDGADEQGDGAEAEEEAVQARLWRRLARRGHWRAG